jgi:hypothetical protein
MLLGSSVKKCSHCDKTPLQLKGRSISEVKGGAKMLAELGKKEYKSKGMEMQMEFATSAYNMSLSLPDLTKCCGWRPEWDAHIFHLTHNGIEAVKQGMKECETQDEGIQALLDMVKKEKV